MKTKSEQELQLRLDIQADSRFPFDRKRVRKAVFELLLEQGTSGKIDISLSVVGDRKMKQLRKKYLGLEGTTDVLSFSQVEKNKKEEAHFEDGKFGDSLMLGDVVVSYVQAKKQAVELGRLIDEEIEFLVCHGVLHLLGIHHD